MLAQEPHTLLCIIPNRALFHFGEVHIAQSAGGVWHIGTVLASVGQA